jgi:hypothetical protein
MLFGLVIVILIVLAAFNINVFLGLALVVLVAWMTPEFVRSWRRGDERVERALKSASQSPHPHLASDAQGASAVLPPSFGVEDLAAYLDERRRVARAQEQAEKDRRQQLRELWTGVVPAVAQAVADVNAKLAEHGMQLIVSEADFMWPKDDPSGFGVECKLLGGGYSLGYDGKQYVAVSERCLYVGGCYAWSEGKVLPLQDPPVGAIADAIAETVRSLLEG